MKEINYKEMRFNPFNLIGGEWMLVTAGDENSCNTMTASWPRRGQDWQGRSHACLCRQYRLFRGSQAGADLQEALPVGVTGEWISLSGHYRRELSPA